MNNEVMGKNEKFASQIDSEVLKELRAYADEADKSISRILSDAVREYLQRASVRPEFRSVADEVLTENEELLRRLAK